MTIVHMSFGNKENENFQQGKCMKGKLMLKLKTERENDIRKHEIRKVSVEGKKVI